MSIDINRIGISFPNTAEAQKASNIMETKLVAMGYEVKVSYAENADAQAAHVEVFADMGCIVVILWAIDEERGEVCEAITYYIGFDYRGFGRQQGEYIKEKLGLDENNESYNIEIFTNNEDIEVIEIFEGIMEILQPYFDSGALMGEVHNVTPLDYGVKENAKMYMMNLVDEKSYTPSNMSLNVV